MWFPSLLLFLAATCAFADVGGDLEACVSHIDVEELENLDSIETTEQLKVFCPMMLNTFSCVEDVLKSETGMTFEDLVEAAEGTEIGRGAAVAVNVRDIFVDLCTEGSSLNEAYLADAECFDTIDTHVDTCKEKADAAKEVLQGFAENAVEVADDDEYTPDADCAEAAYMSACVAAIIHDTCGRRAFDTYNSLIKRSGVFKNILCSAEDLQHLKTTFVDKMDIEDEQKDLLRLALDLKKRRK